MKFIYYDGAYFRPEAVAMITDDSDNFKDSCTVHLMGGQKICLPCRAKYAADIVSDVVNGKIETDMIHGGEQE